MISFNGKDGGVCNFDELKTGEITVYVEDQNGHHAKVVLPDNGVFSELYNTHKERIIRLSESAKKIKDTIILQRENYT